MKEESNKNKEPLKKNDKAHEEQIKAKVKAIIVAIAKPNDKEKVAMVSQIPKPPSNVKK